MIIFMGYPKCSTCKKAKAWLDEHHIIYMERDIVKEHPSKEELTCWFQQFDLPLNQYFNTSGNLYKEMNLKEKRKHLSEEEQLTLLASNGMLIRRPFIVSKNGILIGFKEALWEDFFLDH